MKGGGARICEPLLRFASRAGGNAAIPSLVGVIICTPDMSEKQILHNYIATIKLPKIPTER